MAKKCQPCLGVAVKAAIENSHPELRAVLERITSCDNDLGIVVCGGGRRGGTRQPSEYNQFIGKCVKKQELKDSTAPERLTRCAADWRRSHGR